MFNKFESLAAGVAAGAVVVGFIGPVKVIILALVAAGASFLIRRYVVKPVTL